MDKLNISTENTPEFHKFINKVSRFLGGQKNVEAMDLQCCVAGKIKLMEKDRRGVFLLFKDGKAFAITEGFPTFYVYQGIGEIVKKDGKLQGIFFDNQKRHVTADPLKTIGKSVNLNHLPYEVLTKSDVYTSVNSVLAKKMYPAWIERR